MSFIPSMPSLAGIAVNDTVNLSGKDQLVASLGTITDSGNGQITAVVTLNDSASTVLTLKSSDTILSSYSISQAGVQTAVWSQTKQA